VHGFLLCDGWFLIVASELPDQVQFVHDMISEAVFSLAIGFPSFR
jgi:hypothetical protein